MIPRYGSVVIGVCLAIGCAEAALRCGAEEMSAMADHMTMTAPRPLQPGDQEKAAAVVAAAKQALAPYEDYHKALSDGYRIFLPDVPQPQYHFTNIDSGLAARKRWDPLRPTSLLYKKNPDGSYALVGAMYTGRVDATEDELNQRIPLSIAHWHQHIDLCWAPKGREAEYFGRDAKFGFNGSIATEKACDAAGGRFQPHFRGWMVHVYPNEKDPKKVWATEDDDQGHDNMNHPAMSGMNMN